VDLSARHLALAALLAGLVPAMRAPAATLDAPACVRCADSISAGVPRPLIGLTGSLVHEGGVLVLEGCAGRTTLAGPPVASLDTLAGREAYVRVECLGPDRARPIGGHALGDSVADLFVMGFCPYARALERGVAATLARRDSAYRPPLRLHFLLYAEDSADVRLVRSLHGPRERLEDVVQLSLQELEPEHLWPYLAERADHDDDWLAIARRVGVGWRTLAEIQRRLDHEVDARLLAEWQAVNDDWPSIDGSPTVYWRGAEMKRMSVVPGFGRMPASGSQCPH